MLPEAWGERQEAEHSRGVAAGGTSAPPGTAGGFQQGENEKKYEVVSGKGEPGAGRVTKGEKARSHVWKVLSAPGDPRKEAKGVPGGCQAEDGRDRIMSGAAARTQVNLHSLCLSSCCPIFCRETV